MEKRYIVGLGEALWDVLPEGKKLGGAPANFAYHAGQFLGQENTLAISALGQDKLAEETIDSLKEHKLNYLMPQVPYPQEPFRLPSTNRAYQPTTSRRTWLGTTSPSPTTSRRWHATVVPYVSVRWHSVMSCHARQYTSSSTTPPPTA